MNKSAFNYIVIMSLLILSSCASKTYEWVKINPDKITMAKTGMPYSENVRYVNIRVNAKHKAENITYVENSTDYFTNPVFQPKETANTASRKITKRNSAYRINNTPKIAKITSKPIVQSAPKQSVASKHKAAESDISMSKLNNALIIPKKKKPIAANTGQSNAINPVKSPVKTSSASPAKETKVVSPSEPVKSNKEETLSHDNGLGQLEDLDKELSKNNDLQIGADQPIPDQHIKEEASKRNSYMWIGLVLLIVGLIIGLIFGGLAYLISVVGIVFLLIGYFTKI